MDRWEKDNRKIETELIEKETDGFKLCICHYCVSRKFWTPQNWAEKHLVWLPPMAVDNIYVSKSELVV